MKLFLRIAPLLLLTWNLVPPMGVSAQPQPYAPNPAAQNLIEAVNDLREAEGLPPYRTDAILMDIANTHAQYIASTGVLTHFDALGNRPYQRALNAGYNVAGDISFGGLFSEAIYSGSNLSFEEVVSAWQASAADSNALLSTEFQDIGAAVTAANGINYYVLNVGARTESVTVTGTPATALPTITGTVLSSAISTPLENGEIYHIVQKNEALWSIAIAYGVTIDELKRLNGLLLDDIYEGQKLLIRRAATETPTASPAPVTATLGIPTSTATVPAPATNTPTFTPVPTAPLSLQSSGLVVGGIVLVALLAAGLGAFLSRNRNKPQD